MSTIENMTGALGDAIERARARVNRLSGRAHEISDAELRAAGQHVDRYLANQAVDFTERTIVALLDGIAR